jgi:two-component system response regulator RegX3
MADSPKVLVVDDEESFVAALAVGLEREGFAVECARDGEEALAKFRNGDPDIILLDVMLPRISGVDVCRTIRATSSVPIIMVTAKGTETDTVVGLEVGADDYITKPYRMAEVIARIRAVMRRAPHDQTIGPVHVPGEPVESVSIDDISLDFARHEVTVRGQEVRLPLKEFELLEILMLNAGRVMTREALIDQVWGTDYVGDTKTLDVHIKRLRARIEEDPSQPTHITTVRGVGYRFEERERRRPDPTDR